MLVDLWNKDYKSPFDSPKKIANYRADLQDTFMQRIRKYHQVLLGLNSDRIANWPSVQFILRQAQHKSAGCFPELFRLQIGDNDIYYDDESVKWKEGAFRNGDLRTAWVFHPDDNENYVLSTSGSRYNVYRKDVRKLRGEGITSALQVSPLLHMANHADPIAQLPTIVPALTVRKGRPIQVDPPARRQQHHLFDSCCGFRKFWRRGDRVPHLTHNAT